MNIIKQLESRHSQALLSGRKLPEFSPGDSLRVSVRVSEGTRTRLQVYEGLCIARKGEGLNESFCVRKISYGEGVERVFPLYSPLVEKIEVVRRGKVRRAKLYYLRNLRGKAARISENTGARAKHLAEQEREEFLAQKAKQEEEKRLAAETLAKEKAAEEKQAEKETEKKEEKPSEPAVEAKQETKPATEKPAEEKPAENKETPAPEKDTKQGA